MPISDAILCFFAMLKCSMFVFYYQLQLSFQHNLHSFMPRRLLNKLFRSPWCRSASPFDIIWLTSLGGTGEKPGATTNDCCKTGTFGAEESAVGRSQAAALEREEATEGAGGERVETNDGTTKFGLPCIWLTAPTIEAETGGKPTPETAKADAWDCKLDENVAGTPPATLELASALVGV